MHRLPQARLRLLLKEEMDHSCVADNSSSEQDLFTTAVARGQELKH
jgi:hypothetical protein